MYIIGSCIIIIMIYNIYYYKKYIIQPKLEEILAGGIYSVVKVSENKYCIVKNFSKYQDHTVVLGLDNYEWFKCKSNMLTVNTTYVNYYEAFDKAKILNMKNK